MRFSGYRLSPAWLVFLFVVVVGLAGFLLFLRNAGTPVPASWGVGAGDRSELVQVINAFLQNLVGPLIMTGLAALILVRHPRHRIGRLLMALGLITAAAFFAAEWAVYGAYTVGAPLPGVEFAAWVTNFLWIWIFSPLILMTALFPDGRFVSNRWAGLILALLLLFALPVTAAAMIETPMSSAYQIANPYVSNPSEGFYSTLFALGTPAMPAATLAALASVAVRFRSSSGRERQQMKWLLAGVAVMVLLTLGGLALSFGLDSRFGEVLVNTAILGPALGIGVALLRYRLYDIDVLLRRTLVYAILTALLAAIYFSVIILLQGVFQGLTGSRESPLITVITTLVIAALFSPLRTRIQAGIDRRFYRSKYDAERTIAQFAAAARDEVDMDRLAAALLGVVEETVQPERVEIRLR
ncbi:MAG TPA: hypothetical protein VMN57_16530 [Anaerolineales bacterium]|nr:hypothetical protein [Anaerolineales bacterium]